jgi:hypothetical protein
VHNRRIVAPGLLLLVSLACAQPSAQDAKDHDQATSRELTLPPPAESGAGVASALEVWQPAAPERPAVAGTDREARAAGRVTGSASAIAAAPTAWTSTDAVAAESTTAAPVVTAGDGAHDAAAAAAAAATAEPAIAAGAGQAAGPADTGSGDVAAVEPRAGRRPGVIIRGGVIEDDDCALHLPRGGGVMAIPPPDALVNDRAPRVGITGGPPGARNGADPHGAVTAGPRVGAGSPASGAVTGRGSTPPRGGMPARGRLGGGLRGGF